MTEPREAELEALADAAGILVDWEDAAGRPQRVGPEALRAVLQALDLPADTPGDIRESRRRLAEENAGDSPPLLLTGEVGKPIPLPSALLSGGPLGQIETEDGRIIETRLTAGGLPPLPVPGYHRLEIGGKSVTLALAPRRCFSLADASGSEADLWGLAAQLYGLRRSAESTTGLGDGGLGDFTALGRLCREASDFGCSALAISPLHAMFIAAPERESPYAPSSRLFLNALYIDPARILGEDRLAAGVEALGLAQDRAAWEKAALIDWPAVARGKLAVLRWLFEELRAAGGEDWTAFQRFRTQAGADLEDHARFEALHGHFLAENPALGSWRDWPPAFRDPRGEAVRAFAERHAEEVDFHAFLQWQAHRGLASAQEAARAGGMALGIIADLAVGTDGGGSQAWSRQDENLIGLKIGAPPDIYNPLGQDWGLAAFSPRVLKQNGFRAFIAMLRACMAEAGGLRIDHVMGLLRLWLVPENGSPRDGAYLSFPLEDLLRLVALESWRHRAVVIGEDLGTVPEGFRERLAEKAILGMSVLWFEREEEAEGGGFTAPAAWRRESVAMTSTHDLPTLAGWWRGHDLDLREALQLYPSAAEAQEARQARSRDRQALWNALTPPETSAERSSLPEEPPIEACLTQVARSAARLAIVPLEDLLGLEEQPNLPGTVNEHPNWRRRLPCVLGNLLSVPPVPRRLELLSGARPLDRQDGA